MSTKPYKNLAWLNELSSAEAETALLDCCGSREWAKAMTSSRPFQMIESIFQNADKVWFSLPVSEWLEAFAAHPKIGSNKSAPTQKGQAARWSEREQSGMDSASTETRDALAEVNRLYEDRFGFIFIVCAAGKAAEEMLAICKARLRNSVQTELQIAAEEQRKITEIRLTKLLER